MIELAAFAASHGFWVLRNRFSLNASLAQCDMQRSIPRLILEATATAAMVFLLLYAYLDCEHTWRPDTHAWSSS